MGRTNFILIPVLNYLSYPHDPQHSFSDTMHVQATSSCKRRLRAFLATGLSNAGLGANVGVRLSAVVGLAVARAGKTCSEQATSRGPRRRGVFAFVFHFDLLGPGVGAGVVSDWVQVSTYKHFLKSKIHVGGQIHARDKA